jgi:DNA-binding GntR family transcriptional regulator
MLQLLNSHFNRLRILRLQSNSDWDHIISQHKLIYQLIVNKDEEQAVKVMEQHLRLVVIEKEFLKERYPYYFI